MKIKMPVFIAIFALSFAIKAEETEAQNLLNEIRKDLTSLQANFEQYEIDMNDNESEKLTGQVWLQTPNQFKWQYAEPSPQLILANGETVWIYDEDLEQVSIKEQENTQNPIYVLLNKNDTQENFELRLLDKKEEKNQDLEWLEMTPKNPGEDIKKVWLGISDNTLKVIKLKNQMDSIVIFEFENTVRNPALAEGFFTFEVPQGVDVIRNTGLSAEF
ncbi:MAG: outer membrane lipoprotein chaperone LolA [Marinicellaceae bacterium]